MLTPWTTNRKVRISHQLQSVAFQTCFQVGNDPKIYDLQNKVHTTKQGEMDQSFAELGRLLQEVGYYQDFKVACPNAVIMFKKLIDKEQV